MQLVGKDFHVRFFRQKRQQIYQWKGKEKEKLELLKDCSVTALILVLVLFRWYLAEFDIDTFEMSDEKLEHYKEEVSRDDKPHHWPVEFSGGRRKEIEVSQ